MLRRSKSDRTSPSTWTLSLIGFIVFFLVGFYLTGKASAAPYPIVCGAKVSATWGTGQACWQGNKWKVIFKDTLTDGSCVLAVNTVTGDVIGKSCGAQVTTPDQNSARGARLYRANNYLTIPTTA